MKEGKKIQNSWDNLLIGFLSVVIIYLLYTFSKAIWDNGILEQMDFTLFQAFVTMFMSILLEAFPFIMLGVVISSIIQIFVSEELIARIIPKNLVLGILLGVAAGFLFPVCDCSVIPVVRRLMKKGVPVYIAITFMLCAPIVNPVVLLATNYAFSNIMPEMLFLRTFLGIGIAIVIANLIDVMMENKKVLRPEIHDDDNHCSCSGCHRHETEKSKLSEMIRHAGQEFFDVGGYLIIGALLASISQVFLPREILMGIGQNEAISILVMMVFAYSISLCSTSDSFIAKTFVTQFTTGSIMGFLILGPMLDIKNTIVLFGNFKKEFVIKLIGLIFIITFLVVYTVDKFIGF
ncbi:permease [Petroclostridium sp. X23]|uniref:permease n=1 Tax=Petroclostridium sp. X23 TaxID=3045146 RepID=UPI0024ADE7E4|nr:permease [Petroclostridium sp. X23]WHH60225.1 permease [Petroclostridium sp. X23]